MSKVLKVVGAIVGVAALIASGPFGLAAGTVLGMSASTLTLVAAALTLGSSLLAPRPKAPRVSPAAAERLFASINPRAPRTIAFGSTALATDIRDQEITGSQEYLHRFIVAASHKVQSIREIWFDDKLAWTLAGGVQGEFAGYLTVTPILEGSAANAINISARMGASRRYTGCAYIHLRYKLTGNDKKAESPFAQSIPSRMTIIGDGALIYDPRLDDTAGGEGDQRADDQTSWAWDADAARNPALQLLWYLLGWRIQNPVTGEWKLAVGKGIPADRIDLASFITAANLCDEPVTKAAGGTEPRYRSDGVFSEADDPRAVIDSLKAAMNAELDDLGGRIRLTVLHNDLATPVADFTTDDVLGEFSWDQTPSLADTFNVLRGSYTDPSPESLYQLVEYPEIRIDSPDGIDRVETVDFPMVQSPSQAQRLAKQRIQRMLYSGLFAATFQITGWKVIKGDVVRLTFAPLGWSQKLFRVVEQEDARVDGSVPMVLRVEHAQIYAWDAEENPPIEAAAPTTYDAMLSPIVQGIGDAGETSSWPSVSDPLGTKPEDNATNSADPLSAFGELTVGQFFDVVDGKTTTFIRATAPSAAESAENDIWINTAQGNRVYRRVAGTGALAIGADKVILGGNGVALCWTEATDQRIGQALLDAAGAQATADGKVEAFVMLSASEPEPVGSGVGDILYRLYIAPAQIDRWTGSAWVPQATYGATAAQANSITQSAAAITAILSDAVLSRGEKPAFAREWERAQADYSALIAKAAGFAGVDDAVEDLSNACAALALAIAAISPAYSDTTQDSAIADPAALQAAWTLFFEKHAALLMAISAQTLVVQWSIDGATGWHSDYEEGDKWQRQSADGGASWGTPFKAVGEDGADGSDGLDGEDGLPGAPGADGITPYLHIAYANAADGSVDFTTGAPGSRTHMGVLVDTNPTDSTTPGDYTWSLIKGADGANGTPGAPGADGTPSYAHVAWATAADGSTGFSTTDSTGKTYVGFYTDATLADSTDPADYSWSLIKGADGADGADGSDGADGIDGQHTSFVFKRSATQPDTPTDATTPPAGWSDAPPAQTDPATALWQTSAEFRNATRLTDWGTPKKLVPADLEDLDPGARLILDEARDVAHSKNKVFWQSTPPAASDSQEGDTWFNTALGNRAYRRVAGTGLLTIGADKVTLAGGGIALCWTEAPDQRIAMVVQDVAHTLGIAEDADSKADQAIADLLTLADDSVLTVVEKITVLIPKDAQLEAAWAILDDQADDFGITTERTAAATARSAWQSYRNGLSPAWNATSGDTAVTRATFRTKLGDYEAAIEALKKAISAEAARRANYSLIVDDNGELPEPNADVTRFITGSTLIQIDADHTGAVLSGQYSRTFPFKLSRNGTDVTTSAAWDVDVVSGTVTCAIGAATGLLTFSEVVGEAKLRITATLGGGSPRPYDVQVTKKVAAPPNTGSGGGGAGTSASDTTLTGFTASTTAAQTVSDELTVAVASDGNVDLSLTTDYGVSSSASANESYDLYFAFQWWNGSAWVDVATEEQADYGAYRYYDSEIGVYQDSPGGTVQTAQKTGLTPGSSEKFRLRARAPTAFGWAVYFYSSTFTADGT